MMVQAMEGFDMFVSGRGQVGLTNQTGHPAVVVPNGFRTDGTPTSITFCGNLDAEAGRGIMALLCELHDDGQTIVMVTHDVEISAEAGRIVRLWDGMVADG